LSRTQWVDGTPRLGLVDFDKMALGDPEFDVAAFLTELDYDRVHVERIRDAFISGFEAVAGPLDRRLLDLYAAQERLEKALKSARSVRPDGDLRAEKHLESALAECVEPSA
jgi:aminoglycoside phosphotransferase (APT) family kinase protein